jgi:hypothetical protein
MMVRELVMRTDFLTLLSTDQVAVELEAGWLVKVASAGPNVRRTIGYTIRADWRPTMMQRNFIAALQAEGEKMNAAT